MNMSSNGKVQFIVLASLLSVGCAIKCFQCNSAEHPQCADLTVNDTNSEFFQECDIQSQTEGKPFCRKIVTEVLFAEDIRITRACGWLEDDHVGTDICRKSNTDFINKNSCKCFTEACNSARGSSSWVYSSLLMVVLVNLLR